MKLISIPSSNTLYYLVQDKNFTFLLFLDHVLVGHVMKKVVVADEFECQMKCIGNQTCKSFNVHPWADHNTKRVCELNNKTRQMKPGDFKKKRGSNYYGSVKVC